MIIWRKKNIVFECAKNLCPCAVVLQFLQWSCSGPAIVPRWSRVIRKIPLNVCPERLFQPARLLITLEYVVRISPTNIRVLIIKIGFELLKKMWPYESFTKKAWPRHFWICVIFSSVIHLRCRSWHQWCKCIARARFSLERIQRTKKSGTSPRFNPKCRQIFFFLFSVF